MEFQYYVPRSGKCIYIKPVYPPSGQTASEFSISWDNIGARLQAYDDGWWSVHQSKIIDILAEYATDKASMSIDEMVEVLKSHGFTRNPRSPE